MTLSDQAVRARLNQALPILNPQAGTLLRLCEDPEIDLGTLAKTLENFPVVATRLVGLANSPFYAPGKSIENLHDAVRMLGLTMVRGIALGLVLADRLSPRRCASFDALRFWRSAVLTGDLAQSLATRLKNGGALPPATVYLAGLIHNFGLLALVCALPEEMDAILHAHARASDGIPLGERLTTTLGLDHRQAGRILAEAWSLPPRLKAVLAHYHDPGDAGEHATLVRLVGVAACCSRARLVCDAMDTPPPDAIAGAEAVGLTAGSLREALAQMEKKTALLLATAQTFATHIV